METLELAINYSVEIDSALTGMTSRAVEASKQNKRSMELNSLSKEVLAIEDTESPEPEIIEVEY